VVHRGVCGQLDRLRDAYAALPDLLTQVAAGVARRCTFWSQLPRLLLPANRAPASLARQPLRPCRSPARHSRLRHL
jgi:hypothetical protein